jgi:hypothetical protein
MCPMNENRLPDLAAIEQYARTTPYCRCHREATIGDPQAQDTDSHNPVAQLVGTATAARVRITRSGKTGGSRL